MAHEWPFALFFQRAIHMRQAADVTRNDEISLALLNLSQLLVQYGPADIGHLDAEQAAKATANLTVGPVTYGGVSQVTDEDSSRLAQSQQA